MWFGLLLQVVAASPALSGPRPSGALASEQACKGQLRSDSLLLHGRPAVFGGKGGPARLSSCSTPDQTRFTLVAKNTTICSFVVPGELIRSSFLPNEELLSRTSVRTPELDILFDARTGLSLQGCTALSMDRVEHPLDPLALLEPELGVVPADPQTVWRKASRVMLSESKALALVRSGARRDTVLEESLIESVALQPDTSTKTARWTVVGGDEVLRGLTLRMAPDKCVRFISEGERALESEVCSGRTARKQSRTQPHVFFAGLVNPKGAPKDGKVTAWIVWEPAQKIRVLSHNQDASLVVDVEAFKDAAVPRYEAAEH